MGIMNNRKGSGIFVVAWRRERDSRGPKPRTPSHLVSYSKHLWPLPRYYSEGPVPMTPAHLPRPALYSMQLGTHKYLFYILA